MGPAAVSCICARGYTGDLCDTQIAQPMCGKQECSDGCKRRTSCDCHPKEADFTSARYDINLEVVDQPNINISHEIVKQLSSYLIASNITLDDEVEILNISSVRASGARTAMVRVWSTRHGAGALRAALTRLGAARARTHTLRLLPDTKHINIQPALSLHALAVNQRPEVWEGSEFILTCMAYGPPDIVFTWYKDGVRVNFNGTTRDIWTRTVSEDELGRRMSVLGVASAQQIDAGAWSCAVDDATRRRCRAVTLTVLSPPTIRLVPSTLTLSKGDNVSMTCLAGAGRSHGVLGFSWARERSLLPMQPHRHVWEDLYPAGSVLRLYNIQKSSEYRCQVSSMAGTNFAAVTVWALGTDDEACRSDTTHGVHWIRTAPGAHASAPCPPGYTGEIIRFCEPQIGQQGVKWMMPDFSNCEADTLKEVYEQFRLISYGYSWSNVSDVSRQYHTVLRSLRLHPGEGATPLRHVAHMLQYLLSGAARRPDAFHSATHLLNIYDHLLARPEAFLDEEKIYELQNAIVTAASLRNKLSLHLHSFTIATAPVHRNTAHVELHRASSDEWMLSSAELDILPTTYEKLNTSFVTVLYHDLGTRLPSLRRAVEFDGDREVEFMVCSQQVQVSIRGAPETHTLQHTVTLLFSHSKNYSVDASKLACGFRSMKSPGVWSISACEVRVSGVSHAACRCRAAGTIALLTPATHISTDTETELRGAVVVSVSACGAMCLCACALQLLSAARDWLLKLLRGAVALGHAGAMLSLLQCEAAACPGAAGWAVAACWCAAGAGLCAVPLALTAELAGTAPRTHCVALLAGVCVLAFTCARLWGGGPLALGSAASRIIGATAALLATGAAALALCAARSATHLARKLPSSGSRVLRHTLLLLLTSSCSQAAGVAYVQPAERQVAHVAALSVAALANGVAILVCYVFRDEECVRAARRMLSLQPDTRAQTDTSLSLYIKQGGEVESRGGATMDSSSTPVSPAAMYWHDASLESTATMYRRQSNPDCRADIVRCVEYRDCVISPRRGERAGPVCDLIPARAPRDYVATVCLELGARHEPPPQTQVTCPLNFEPYSDKNLDTPKANCTICAQSTPDVSLTSQPIKSCLKKKSCGFTSSTSMPSIDTIKDDNKSHIEHVNREWSKAYDNPQTEKMLHKISTDLDFLLNRTKSKNIAQEIEEAPT
ncbi:uncharacterized protein LOC142981224 isoform X2 [Anticarsia gemmatalis]